MSSALQANGLLSVTTTYTDQLVRDKAMLYFLDPIYANDKYISVRQANRARYDVYEYFYRVVQQELIDSMEQSKWKAVHEVYKGRVLTFIPNAHISLDPPGGQQLHPHYWYRWEFYEKPVFENAAFISDKDGRYVAYGMAEARPIQYGEHIIYGAVIDNVLCL